MVDMEVDPPLILILLNIRESMLFMMLIYSYLWYLTRAWFKCETQGKGVSRLLFLTKNYKSMLIRKIDTKML